MSDSNARDYPRGIGPCGIGRLGIRNLGIGTVSRITLDALRRTLSGTCPTWLPRERIGSMAPTFGIASAAVFLGMMGPVFQESLLPERASSYEPYHLEAARIDRQRIERRYNNLQARYLDLQHDLNATRRDKAKLSERNAALSVAMSEERKRRRALLHHSRDLHEDLTESGSEQGQLIERIAVLENTLSVLRQSQLAMIEELREKAQKSSSRMEQAVAMTGIDLQDLLSKLDLESAPSGGPFVPAPDELEDAPGDVESSWQSLGGELGRTLVLQEVVSTMPLGAPLREYRITSGFGHRTDPINGRRANHLGLDLAAKYGSSVVATAPGVVTFAGWQRGYGRIVEICHDYGFTTRYAHLRKLDVKKGQKVQAGQKVGALGSSGRSTGAHVHYEVHHNHVRRNPLKFVMAGRHIHPE